jgi:hypothetical protein
MTDEVVESIVSILLAEASDLERKAGRLRSLATLIKHETDKDKQ